jgi:hypothetical protein
MNDAEPKLAAASLGLDVRRLDDGPPLLDFGLLQCAERLRRLLFDRQKILAKIGEALTHRRIGQRIHDSRIELADDPLWSALGASN